METTQTRLQIYVVKSYILVLTPLVFSCTSTADVNCIRAGRETTLKVLNGCKTPTQQQSIIQAKENVDKFCCDNGQ